MQQNPSGSWREKLDRLWQETKIFLSTRLFWKNFAGIMAYFLGFLLLTSWFMKCYTNHGESLQVHDYVGMDLREAVEKAKSRSFRVVVADSVFIPGKAPLVVVAQNPTALSRVKENRTIYLTITKATADLVTLPDIAGGNDDLTQYQKKLGLLGINTRIVSRVFSDKLAENTILEVIYLGDTITHKLPGGYKAGRGTTIDLVVSERGGTTVMIPNLVCKKYDAAKFIITSFNLSLGSVVKDNTVNDELNAYVWKQSPEYTPDGRIRVGEQIDIYLTQKPPAGCKLDELDQPAGEDFGDRR